MEIEYQDREGNGMDLNCSWANLSCLRPLRMSEWSDSVSTTSMALATTGSKPVAHKEIVSCSSVKTGR